jgi:eukaryotic-like serine/threonine-protein kinase
MTPERWQRVKELFQAAVAEEANQRAAFLEKACAGDPALRKQVEALLASHEQAASFLESPTLKVTALLPEDEVDLMIGQRIGPYEVLSEIGRGGMGVVYLAQDKRLGRQVALKFLPVSFQDNPDRRARLLTEARAASSLHSPHIAAIHDIGEHEGRAYIVMEYVGGELLSQKLKGGPPALDEGIDIARQVAEALEEAHAHGIIHRDIKSSNLVVTPRGQVKVLDFGLAKVTQRSGAGIANEESALTAQQGTTLGMVLGTVHYMSPEQARGLEVDGRSDLFSLGVVVYEMVTGRLPFEGETSSDVLAAILEREPQPLARHRPEVPAELERVVRQCLEKDRQRRYQSAGELLIHLRKLKRDIDSGATTAVVERHPTWQSLVKSSRLLVVAILVMLLMVLSVYLLWFRGTPRSARFNIESLAVLPLENLSGDPAQEYFADGMTEELITNLAKIGTLKVISRTSAMRYKGANKPLPQIAQELKVDALVEGSVLRTGNRVRVTAQLIHGATDTHLWAESYEQDLRDLMHLQSEIARAIAREVRVKLRPEDRERLAAVRPVNAAAHEAYLRGRVSWNKQTDEALKKAVEYFQQAIDEDPLYAPAYAGLADTYLARAFFAHSAMTDMGPLASAAARRATELDDKLAEGHVSLGLVKAFYDWSWPDAETEFKRAIELRPSYGDAHHWYSHYFQALGQVDPALGEMKRALELDPLTPHIHNDIGRYLYFKRQYDQAIEQFQKAIEVNPSYHQLYWDLGNTYSQKSMFREALAAQEKAYELSKGSVFFKGTIAYNYAAWGRRDKALELLTELKELSKRNYVLPLEMAITYAALGEKERAFELLNKACEERSYRLAIAIKLDPRYDPLRSDLRFQDLLRRMRLPS